MAIAARAFGDDYPPISRHWLVRCAGIAYLLASIMYLPWLLASLNRHIPWLSWPFFCANVFTLITTYLSVANNWWRVVPERHPLPHGAEPKVGIIVPCCGEPVGMILRTVTSILQQDWPLHRMSIVVSDDGHDPLLEHAVKSWPVTYHSPPPRFAPGRDGAAKAGNLNSAVELLVRRHPDVRYIETRDCDDELGSNSFLRQVVGQLERDPRLAYVQTIKEAQVSAGDPFNNRETMFYRGQMLARNAANAAFPCGSGVVWRREALKDIGLFPTWNLVEDLQSGVEALRRGWRSLYLPIVGAMGQHSPEDVPNVYKQRGTWAIDTVRLMIWGDLRGLSLRQRHPIRDLWRVRIIWSGMAPVFAKASIQAIAGGRNHKPIYKVTRKHTDPRWHWGHTMPQSIVLALVLCTFVYALRNGTLPPPIVLLPFIYWGGLYVALFAGFVARSWYGVSSLRKALLRGSLTLGSGPGADPASPLAQHSGA